MRVGVEGSEERSRLQQLDEEGLLADLCELLDLTRRTVGQLDAVHPLGDEQAARGEALVHLG